MNEHQKVVLDYLKQLYIEDETPPILLFSAFGWQHYAMDTPKEVGDAYETFAQNDDLEVIEAFTEWAFDQLEPEAEVKKAFDDMFDDSVH